MVYSEQNRQYAGRSVKMTVMQNPWLKLALRPAGWSAGCAIVAALLLAALPPAPVQALDMRPHCPLCRRYTDTSPARLQAYVPLGKRTKVIDACSVFCLIEQLEDYETEPAFIYCANYATFGEKDPLPLRTSRAYFVYESDTGDEEKTAEPYTYAFATEDEATEFADANGGEVLEWDDVVERVTELTDEWEPEPEKVRSNVDPYRRQRR